ncbi:MAG: transglutaminase family protein [Burkholderiales bacterium]|nr:transglutaminase family protein [Burkholderiales bacterium]MDE2275117.1 transglutaminase family protein [Burkholderiales bacterium]
MSREPGLPVTSELEVVHETRYAYAAPVSLAHHLAHLQPLHDAHQRLHGFELEIDPPPGCSRDGVDAMGNAERHFSLAQPHRALRVRSRSRCSVADRFAALRPEAAPAWDGLAARLRYVARGPFEPATEFAQPSPYVPRLAVLRDYAATSFAPGRPVAAAAIELMHRVHADFRYQSLATEVDTPLAEVWARRVGVCQDFAHLMAGAMRMLGLPVRYVSGYLLTQAAAGGPALQGADASHAWVQVWCPGTPGVPGEGAGAGWLDLDPTNDLVPAGGHVRLAVGRDFGDVTPLRGVIRGGGAHTLRVAVSTRRLAPPSPERELLAGGQQEIASP